MSKGTHPAFSEWLGDICRGAGFKPRILHDADLEAGILSVVAEGLGVSLAREQIKRLPHAGVTFRPLTPPVRTDYCIAWRRENRSKPLQEYIQIVKKLSPQIRLTLTSPVPVIV
jgi:DNA-binding transcriptional LysR family regulator